jgi:hypothetical protein
VAIRMDGPITYQQRSGTRQHEEELSGLFNSSLEGNTRRAIDFHEDDEIDEKAFATLIRAAVSLNESSSR